MVKAMLLANLCVSQPDWPFTVKTRSVANTANIVTFGDCVRSMSLCSVFKVGWVL